MSDVSSGFDSDEQLGDDDKPYMTLGYANGPGYYDHRTADGSLDTEQPRMDLTNATDEISTRLVVNYTYTFI